MIDVLEKLHNASRIEQLEIYLSVLERCFELKNEDIYIYFDEFIVLLDEFLAFETKPSKEVKEIVGSIFEVLFRFIRYSNNIKKLDLYFPSFEKYKFLFNSQCKISIIYQYFGYLMWLKQNTPKAIEYLTNSLDIANKYCKPEDNPARYTNLGYIYESVGKTNKAEYYYSEGLNFAKRNNSIGGLKMVYNAMGRLSGSKGLYNNAVEYYLDCLSLYDEKKDVDRASTLNNLAAAYISLKNYTKARELLESLNEEWLEKEDPELYYATLSNSGVMYTHLKQYDFAERIYLKCLEFSKKVEAAEQLVGCYINLGSLYEDTGRKEESFEYYNEALKLSLAKDNEHQLRSIYTHFVRRYMEEKDYKKSLEYLDKLTEIAKNQNNLPLIMSTLESKAECYEKMGNYRLAYNSLVSYKKKQIAFEKKEKEKTEREENPLIGSRKRKHYLFTQSNSLISRELSTMIGTDLLGKDIEMRKLISKVLLASSNSSSSILIKGESGTGKEIIARLLHYSSPRAKGPFIAVNSASFSPGVMHSALFGHVKGAFTGAVNDQIGHFEAANNGTLFLDEIGEMPHEVQIALLRVLEEKTVIPIGSNIARKVNFRLISATNIDIEKHVKEGKMRLDFLNRINTFEIDVPPLRNRKDDIPILVEAYLEKISSRLEIQKPKLSISALKMLCDYDYPGNIRELKNMMEKLIIFNDKKEITTDDVFHVKRSKSKDIKTSSELPRLNLESLEKQAIYSAMAESKNVKTEAARLLGITSYALHRRLKKYEIDL